MRYIKVQIGHTHAHSIRLRNQRSDMELLLHPSSKLDLQVARQGRFVHCCGSNYSTTWYNVGRSRHVSCCQHTLWICSRTKTLPVEKLIPGSVLDIFLTGSSWNSSAASSRRLPVLAVTIPWTFSFDSSLIRFTKQFKAGLRWLFFTASMGFV